MMFRWLIQILRELKCKHEWKYYDKIKHFKASEEEPKILKNILICKKCCAFKRLK